MGDMLTHEVFNQSTPLQDIDLYASDCALQDSVRREGGGAAADALCALGRQLGAAQTLELGRLANEYPPVLKTYDRFGHRIDEIEFHPAWHRMMSMLIGEGVHATPWATPGAGAQVARAARYLMFAQVENGSQCPTTMTYAVAPLLAQQPELAASWLPKLLSHEYDPSSAPLAAKRGVLMGMGMTEKQGGSDVRANTTLAVADGKGEWGDQYRITGHKWFMSAPMCDAFLVLAQTDLDDAAGLSCFFLPRWLPDGTRNAMYIERLKDKLGNRSNASGEVEFRHAVAYRVGAIGRGVPTILEMGNLTRLDCAIGTSGIMRWALANAIHHASQRSAFRRPLVEQPLMRNVLADMALESEAATALSLRLARALDERAGDPAAEALVRVGTPLAKFWVCKRGVWLGFEAMEVLGGNGYTEEAPMARMYRELPVNSIWEGSGNIMCLDVLRALARPGCREALTAELSTALGANRNYDAFVQRLARTLPTIAAEPSLARRLVEDLARAWQAALLVRGAPSAVSDAFCASRLDTGGGAGHQTFGALPAGVDLQAIVERARPAV